MTVPSRLLSLNSYHYRRGGSDAVYLAHDEMFRQAGWQTAVMSMHHPRNLPSPWSEFFVDELELGHSYTLRQKLGMAGKVVYSFEAQRKLRQLLARFPAQVAHLHCVYHHLSPSVLPVLKAAGVKTVLTAHDLKLACPAYVMRNAGGVCERCKGGNLLNVVAHRCIHGSLAASAVVMVEAITHRVLGTYRQHLDAVVAPSRFQKAKLVEWGWDPARIHYLPNFVDCEALQPSDEVGSRLLYFGRLSAEKGLRTLVRAALDSGVELDLVGTGPLQAELQQLAGDSPRIRFLGYRSGAELWQTVSAARAVVLPSECYENAPMSVLESFALGKPVIGARIGGLPELLDADSGWTFESGNAAALATLLAEVAAAPDHRLREMGRAGCERVRAQFTRAQYLQRMQALYASL